MIKKLLLVFMLLLPIVGIQAADSVIVAYVTSWKSHIPNPTYITHINYAFGHVTDTFDGMRIDNPERLQEVVALKEQNPNLKVLVSVGGWGSGRFSEMAASPKLRMAFVKDCARKMKDYKLDGIDIDWEYPTQSSAQISSSPDDIENFTLLFKDMRKVFGKNKLITLATVSTAAYYDLKSLEPYVDFINIMAYDMGNPPAHHSALYRSSISSDMTSDLAVKKHLAHGVPAQKLVLGMPFYGHSTPDFPYKGKLEELKNDSKYTEKWDEIGKVPYWINQMGEVVYCPENERSLGFKAQYVKDKGLLGVMYWEASQDTPNLDYARTLYEVLIEGKKYYEKYHRVLVLAEGHGQHKPMTDAAIQWLIDESQTYNFGIEVMSTPNYLKSEADFDKFDLIIQLDFPPYTWSEETAKAFVAYMNKGKGAWIGFHHATLLGEFDGYGMWDWFSNFMGGIKYDNYIEPLADATVHVEKPSHPIMKGVSSSFVIPDDEWYTYNKSPRENVVVLMNVDENSYKPDSPIKMGDHPVVWINPKMPTKNVYIQMGHSPKLYKNKDFTQMLRNAILWSFWSLSKE